MEIMAYYIRTYFKIYLKYKKYYLYTLIFN